MKTAAIAATAILALLVVGVAATISAHSVMGLAAAQTSTTTTDSTTSTTSTAQFNGDDNQNKDAQNQVGEQANSDHDDGDQDGLKLTVGQTLTLANLTGFYESATNSSIKGTASGSLTLKVTDAFSEGYVLSITSGTISVAGSTYTVTGGSVTLASNQWVGGTGTTSGSGQFLIHVGIHDSSTTKLSAQVVLDMKVGGSEYLVSLGAPGSGEASSE
jgi:hypothetical protein